MSGVVQVHTVFSTVTLCRKCAEQHTMDCHSGLCGGCSGVSQCALQTCHPVPQLLLLNPTPCLLLLQLPTDSRGPSLSPVTVVRTLRHVEWSYIFLNILLESCYKDASLLGCTGYQLTDRGVETPKPDVLLHGVSAGKGGLQLGILQRQSLLKFCHLPLSNCCCLTVPVRFFLLQHTTIRSSQPSRPDQ